MVFGPCYSTATSVTHLLCGKNIQINRDGTVVRPTTTAQLLRDTTSAVLPKEPIAKVTILHNLNMQYISVCTITYDQLLKSRYALEKVIHSFLPSVTSLQQEVQVAKVIIHKVPITQDVLIKDHEKYHTSIQRLPSGVPRGNLQRWTNRMGRKTPQWPHPLRGTPIQQQCCKASCSVKAISRLPNTFTSMEVSQGCSNQGTHYCKNK